MRNLLIYSSLTGNTKKVAEACYSICNEDWDLKTIDSNVDLNLYKKVVLGCWIDKGTADKKSLELISKLENKNVAFFITLGAYPNSDHANESITRIKLLLEEKGNQIHSSFICQGAIDPKLIAWMKKLPEDHPHSPNAERIKRWADAEKHPNQEDFDNAKDWFLPILNWSE